MNKPNYTVFRLTRVMTTVCMLVVLSVGIYSAFLAVKQTYYKYAVSANIHNSVPTVIIDAGHGGEDGGTQSATGILEKDLNLSIAAALCDLFDFFGFDTVMTREDDSQIYDSGCETIREKKVSDTKNRLKIIQQHNNGIFISIHQNHFFDGKYSGAQTFYSPKNEESKPLASGIQKSIASSLQPDNDREIKPTGSEIYLLHNSQIPSVMVECGFLSNSEEAEMLCDEDYQKQMAVSIFVGTYNYLVKRGG